MVSTFGGASDTPYATSPVGAASEQQLHSSLLASADPESGPAAARGAKGPRRPYRPGSFLSRNRYAPSSTASSGVASKDGIRGVDSSTLPPPQILYSRPSAASSGGTLTNTSSAVSGTASPTAAFGERTPVMTSEPKLGGSLGSSEGSAGGDGWRTPAYSSAPCHAQYMHLGPEDDDWLHEVKSEWKDHKRVYLEIDKRACCLRGFRGCINVCSLVALFVGILFLFMGYPLLVFFLKPNHTNKEGHGLGGTNATGQVPYFGNLRTGLIDPDTPKDAYTKMNIDGTKKMNLVFSDEFEQDGRSFYPGDDPFWAAENLEYWETGDMEWYDPAAITTVGGALRISLTEHRSHNKNFRSGLLTSWNKFCFTGGLLEVAVTLPGTNDVSGFWPAAWCLGNLARGGYGATTQGMWPYSYDSCDVGTLPNQTWPAEQGGGPEAAVSGGDKEGALSYLPGQRLSSCTCPGEDHPGPVLSDGTLRGRGAPEIDVFEISAGKDYRASQSLQSAPYNAKYRLPNTAGGVYYAPGRAEKNSYEGGVYQQAVSGISKFKSDAFEKDGAVFNVMGMEYKPGLDDDSYVAWLTDGKLTWSVRPPAMAPDKLTEIDSRPFPQEPMYILMNLGMSTSFSWPDWENIEFPAHLQVDYVRVYQPEGEENVGCDPPDYPTKDYIERHIEAYTNANLTTWTEPKGLRGGFGQTFPKNRLLHKC